MDIKTIFDLLKNVGCLTFATINEGYPETRIVDLLMTMKEFIFLL